MDIYTACEQAYLNGFEAGMKVSNIAIEQKYYTLKRLLNGEWVDTDLVQDALGITFAEGIKMFNFGRIAKWAPAPKNGQKIVTKFRLCEKTIDQLGDHPFETEEEIFADNTLGYL